MSEQTDAPQEAASVAPARKPAGEGQPAASGEPRFALFIATACGLGYIPLAPGTFGSLAGLLAAMLPFWILAAVGISYTKFTHGDAGFFFWLLSTNYDPALLIYLAVAILVAVLGVWSANRAARFWRQKDPQRVVIDEVSGQHLTLLLGLSMPVWWKGITSADPNWKYLLLGFILFRVFDIWKPFPARQAESLRGGWGIMADDWVAGIYAAIGLWIARAAGL